MSIYDRTPRTSRTTLDDEDDDLFVVDPDAVSDLGYDESPLVRQNRRGLIVAGIAVVVLAGVVLKIGIDPILAVGHGLVRIVQDGLTERTKVVVEETVKRPEDRLAALPPDVRKTLLSPEPGGAAGAFRWKQAVDPVRFCKLMDGAGLKNDGWKPLFEGSPVHQCMTDLIPVPGSKPVARPAPVAEITDPDALQEAGLEVIAPEPQPSTFFFSARGTKDRLETIRFKLNLDDDSVRDDAEKRLFAFVQKAAEQMSWSVPQAGFEAIRKRERYLGSAAGVTVQIHPETSGADRVNVVFLLMEEAPILAGNKLTPYPGPKPILAPNPNAALLPADQALPVDPTVEAELAAAKAAQSTGVQRTLMPLKDLAPLPEPDVAGQPGAAGQPGGVPGQPEVAGQPGAAPGQPEVAGQPGAAPGSDPIGALVAAAPADGPAPDAQPSPAAGYLPSATPSTPKSAPTAAGPESAPAEPPPQADVMPETPPGLASAPLRTAALPSAEAPVPDAPPTLPAPPPGPAAAEPPTAVTPPPGPAATAADAMTAAVDPAAAPAELPPLPRRRPPVPVAPVAERPAPATAESRPVAEAAPAAQSAPARRKGPLVLLPTAAAPPPAAPAAPDPAPAEPEFDDESLPGVRTSSGLVNPAVGN
ncbi:DUF6030 family protein [Chthonobacter rhizosphaerae]|uniref:DUF6030 family protein n=1 Tax=Chthonobacter rhizosphaerae TaxID=2735553 RepID=UPI0015EF3324|nr:DUF6030 family protein [Chthonobacter rhizosphaerae]